MDERYKELVDEYNSNIREYERQRDELEVRNQAVGDTRRSLAERWKGSAPHSDDLEAAFKAALEPVRIAMTEYLEINVERKDRLAAASKILKKPKFGGVEKKLPEMGRDRSVESMGPT